MRRPTFRIMWLAAVTSNIGTWMHGVGAGWFMTSLSPTPLMVALVQAAATLPAVFLALPAGALADILDRRKFLIVTQIWMVVVALALGVLTLLDAVTSWRLLAFTLALGCGGAMMLPAWAAITPELVPRRELPSAVVLNSVGVNVAKAAGPAMAGVLIVAGGPATVFMLNALSFFGVVWALVLWRRQPEFERMPGERLLPAIRAGVVYVLQAPAIKAVMIRGAAFFTFASASLALLPLVAQQELGRGPEVYGILLASVGVGAIAGAGALPALHRKVSFDALAAGGTVLYAVALIALALVHDVRVLGAAMMLSGAAWIGVFSTLQVVAQLSLPGWVRARGLSVVLMVIMGSMAGGSAVWGQLAALTSIPAALITAGLGSLVAIVVTRNARLSGHEPG